MSEKLYTPEQVAQILQIHQFTVLKFIKQGRLKASKLGRVYRIRESDVEIFLEESANIKSQPNSKNSKDPETNIVTKVKTAENKKQKQKFLSSNSQNQLKKPIDQKDDNLTGINTKNNTETDMLILSKEDNDHPDQIVTNQKIALAKDENSEENDYYYILE